VSRICCSTTGPTITCGSAAANGASNARRVSSKLKQALAGVCQAQIIPYALMGFSAAMRFDPLLNYKRVSAYVLSDVNKIVSALELSADAARGNVSLWVPYDEGVLQGAQEFLGVRVTSPAQTYLDLMDGTARGEKAAHLLWETCLKDKWSRKVDGNTTLVTCAPVESAEEAVFEKAA
jgi:hypothetical protein